MTTKRKRATPKSRPARAGGRTHRLQPDKPVAVLAGLGLLITGYLSFSSLASDAPLFCGPSSGCGLIQNSSYSTLLGLPIALWGFGLYLAVLWSAVTLPPRLKRWRRLAWLTSFGLGISLYLTATGVVALDAWCAWCLSSLAVMGLLFATVMLRRPAAGPGMSWPVFLRNLLVGTVFVTGALAAWQNDLLQPPENPRLRALATHLDESGAKFYGAFWCPNCQEQKRLFGRSADRLPYVECTPNGRGGMVAFECVAAGITGYPTWIIDGRRFQQVMTPEELARRSGFEFKEQQQ